jgi:hypothetical protein
MTNPKHETLYMENYIFLSPLQGYHILYTKQVLYTFTTLIH